MDPSLITALTALACLVVGFYVGRSSTASSKNDMTLTNLQEDLKSAQEMLATAKSQLRDYKRSEEFLALLETERERGRNEGQKSALGEFKTSDDFANLLAIEHEKGKRSGAAEELEKFHITYTPILVDVETFISRKVDVGYDMQIHYSGFPIGEPTRRITNRQEKSKDENIKLLLDTVNKSLELAVEVASKSGIPITIGKSAKRVKR